MASFSFILGVIGNVISIFMFASPIKTFKQIINKRSTENFKGIPYITTLLSTSLWTFYGLLKPGGLLVVTVNVAGAALHVIYVALFLVYAPKHIKMKSLKLVGLLNVGFLGVVIIVTLVAFRNGTRIMLVGVLCAGLTIGMYASPLSAMFLNGGVWAAYAVLVKDFYIGIPNGVGFILGTAQLILYAIYCKNKADDDDTVEKHQGGSTHLAVMRNPNFIQMLQDDTEKKHSPSQSTSLKVDGLP